MSCGDKSRRLTFWWGSDECGFLSMASFPPGPTLTNPDRALLKAAGRNSPRSPRGGCQRLSREVFRPSASSHSVPKFSGNLTVKGDSMNHRITVIVPNVAHLKQCRNIDFFV